MILRSKKSPIILFISLAATLFSFTATAGESIQKQLEMCKQEFAISHDKNTPQAGAYKARLNHLKLMKDILEKLNHNSMGKKLSNEQLQEKVMVMSHLMQMMVEEDLAKKMSELNIRW